MLSILTFLFAIFTCSGPQGVTLEVESCVAGGEVRLAVFEDAEAFELAEAVLGKTVLLGRNSLTSRFEIEVPTAGDYVFAAFHDLNGNGILDRNFFGVPSEPYGFARVPPSKWRAPAFQEVASSVNRSKVKLKIELRRWKEY